MTVERTISKRLAGDEDFALGEGTETQSRNGQNVTITQVRRIQPVNSTEELNALDTSRYVKACLFNATTDTFHLYEYSDGTWNLLKSADVDPAGSLALETKELASGQVAVTFTNPTDAAAFHVSGPNVDNTRLFAGKDYSVNHTTKTVTLFNSYPAGTNITSMFYELIGSNLGTASTLDFGRGDDQVPRNSDLVKKSRTEMKAITGLTAGDVVYLSEVGRPGPFEYLVGDYSAEVVADPREGVYVALDSDPDGSERVLKRKDCVLNVSTFGGLGDGTSYTEDTAAFQGLAAFVDAYPNWSFRIERPPVKWSINDTVEWLSGLTSFGDAPYSIDAELGTIIQSTVVPAFAINTAGSYIADNGAINNLIFEPVGYLGYAFGMVRVRRGRNWEYNNVKISGGNSNGAYLLEFDGSYSHTTNNCDARGANCYLFEHVQTVANGEEDTCTSIGDRARAAALGFIRKGDEGRHNYLFLSPKALAESSAPSENVHSESTLTSSETAGATSVTVADASDITAGRSFLVGKDDRAEIVVADPSYVSGLTIPLANPLRFNKNSGEPTLVGSFGLHLSACDEITLKNPMFERGAAGVIRDNSVRNVVIDNYLCSMKDLVMTRSTSGADGIEVGSGRFASVSNWGAQYINYNTAASLASGNRPTFNRYSGLYYTAATSDTKNIVVTNDPETSWYEKGYLLSASVESTGSASIGTGVTLSVADLSEYVESGETITFSNGGLLVLTSDAKPGETSLTGNLSVVNVSAGELGAIKSGSDGQSVRLRSTAIQDDGYGFAKSIFRVIVNTALRFTIRQDGSVKGRQFFSHKATEDGNESGVSVAASGTLTLYSGASFEFNRNEVSLVWCKTLGQRINIVGLVTSDDSYSSINFVELINTSNSTGGSIAVVGTDLVLTNNNGTAQTVRFGKTVINAGR